MDPTETPAPEETPDQPVEADAPAATEAATSEESLAPFNINDVPEEYREYVEAYNKQTQSAFTKKTTELAAERKRMEEQSAAFIEAQTSWEALQNDPEYQRQVRDQLDEILNAEAAGEYTDDLDPAALALARIEALEETLNEQHLTQQQQAQQDAELEHLSRQMAAIEKEAERELSDDEVRWLTSYAITNPDAEGLPDMKSAFVHYEALLTQQQQAYKQSKVAPVAPSGVAVTKDQIPNTKEARVQAMADIINAG